MGLLDHDEPRDSAKTMNLLLNQRIDELLKAEDPKLQPEAEALLLAAKMCNEGHSLPSEEFLRELTETIKDRRAHRQGQWSNKKLTDAP